MKFLLQILQGILVGLGAGLPGVSGGVLCVIFGIYKTIIEFLANPLSKFKTHFFKLLPYGIGVILGVLGSAKFLLFFFEKYEFYALCVFIGLIIGMLPSLFREAGEQGRSWKSYLSLLISMILIFALLISLEIFSVKITPNFLWYGFCGVCVALSIIAPGMSFSTLLMPLNVNDEKLGTLYNVLLDGIGNLQLTVLIPLAIGAILTILLFSKLVDNLFKRHHSIAFHAIIGVVIAATAMILPFESFTKSPATCVINIVCLICGIGAALLLDKFNQKFEK